MSSPPPSSPFPYCKSNFKHQSLEAPSPPWGRLLFPFNQHRGAFPFFFFFPRDHAQVKLDTTPFSLLKATASQGRPPLVSPGEGKLCFPLAEAGHFPLFPSLFPPPPRKNFQPFLSIENDRGRKCLFPPHVVVRIVGPLPPFPQQVEPEVHPSFFLSMVACSC